MRPVFRGLRELGAALRERSGVGVAGALDGNEQRFRGRDCRRRDARAHWAGDFRWLILASRTRVISLASGSSGNALLVQHGSVSGLIDCGIGPNRLRIRAADIRVAAGRSQLRLCHARAYRPYSSDTRAAQGWGARWLLVPEPRKRWGLAAANGCEIKHGARFECGGIEVSAVRTSHDAAESLGAVVQLGS